MTPEQRWLAMSAAKFRAETTLAEPPCHIEPTDTNLRAMFAHVARPLPERLYPALRAAL